LKNFVWTMFIWVADDMTRAQSARHTTGIEASTTGSTADTVVSSISTVL
jgi:hypothetical protein